MGLREQRTVTGPDGTWKVFVHSAEHTFGHRRGNGHVAIYIEAVCDWYPGQERRPWTTTDVLLPRVLDEIEEALAHGKVVQPIGAFYSGSTDGNRVARPQGFVCPDVPVAALSSLRYPVMDAYERLEELPPGRARAAAWSAYALETYGDRLLRSGRHPGFVSQDTAHMASRLFSLSGEWLVRVDELTGGSTAGETPSERIPAWDTPTRSQEQLDGMHDTLETLRTFVAYELGSEQLDDPEGLRARLEAIDNRLETAAMLSVPRNPPELRRGIGGALASGLAEVLVLGRLLALPEINPPC